MKTYTVIKTIINKEISEIFTDINKFKINTSILNTFNTSTKCIDYIESISRLLVNDTFHVVTKIQNVPPTENDFDGLYLVNKLHKTNEYYVEGNSQFDIYLKITTQIKGYLYNGCDINIKHIGSLTICVYECNSTENKNTYIPACKTIDTASNSSGKTLNYSLVITELKEKLQNLNKYKID